MSVSVCSVSQICRPHRGRKQYVNAQSFSVWIAMVVRLKLGLVMPLWCRQHQSHCCRSPGNCAGKNQSALIYHTAQKPRWMIIFILRHKGKKKICSIVSTLFFGKQLAKKTHSLLWIARDPGVLKVIKGERKCLCLKRSQRNFCSADILHMTGTHLASKVALLSLTSLSLLNSGPRFSLVHGSLPPPPKCGWSNLSANGKRSKQMTKGKELPGVKFCLLIYL